MSFRKTFASAVVALGMTMGGGAFAATIVNLGFGIDHSGSIGIPDYILQQQGLANALSLIPTSGDFEYRVGVVTFGADVKTLVAPTIVTAANIADIQSAITTHIRSNTGMTFTGTAINSLTSQFSAYDMTSTLTMFNISTDGSPAGGDNVTAAAANAFAAGLNSLSFELVGSFGSTQINNMLALAGPDATYVTNADDLPNATEKGFVFAVDNFSDYQEAISAKVQAIIDDVDPPAAIPLPAAGWLMLGGIGALAAIRRRNKAA